MAENNNILKQIEEAIPRLSAKQKIVAISILQDPLSAAFLSVKEFSQKINVSPATIVRFAHDITGDGFPQLQAALHSHIQTESNPIKRMKLHISVNSKDDEFLARVYDTQLENLRKAFNQELFRSIGNAYRLISEARHIYTLGSRGSFSVSYYLAQHLNRALGNADMIPEDDKLAEFLNRATENDTAFFVCFPRYSARLLAAAKALKAKSVKIITLNNSSDSPFLRYSDVSFFADSTSSDFHNSLMAPMLIAELLISLVISKKSEPTLRNLNAFEQYFTMLNQFYDQNAPLH